MNIYDQVESVPVFLVLVAFILLIITSEWITSGEHPHLLKSLRKCCDVTFHIDCHESPHLTGAANFFRPHNVLVAVHTFTSNRIFVVCVYTCILD